MILTREDIDKNRWARHLLPDPGPEVVGHLLDTIDARDAEIATLNSRIESWKREEVLRDEREVGKDAEIAALKADLERSEARSGTKDNMLRYIAFVTTGDSDGDPQLGADALKAWHVSMDCPECSGPLFWDRITGECPRAVCPGCVVRSREELKATLDQSAKANNALALKIGRLVEAGDAINQQLSDHTAFGCCKFATDSQAAWIAAKGAKEGPAQPKNLPHG